MENYKYSRNKLMVIHTLDGVVKLLSLHEVPEGSIIEPENIIIPTTVTMRQARLALLQSGLLSGVNTAITAMSGPEGDAARITWEFSATVEKTNPLITQLATALNLTELQIDDLFTLANTL